MRLSLRRLILLTLLTLTLTGSAAVGIISYRAARVSLEREAIRLTGLVAENRRMSLMRTLTRQHERLARMVDVAARRCGAMRHPAERSACYIRTADALSTIEGASAARLDRPDGPPVLVGPWHEDNQVPADQVIAVHRHDDRPPIFVTAAERHGVRLAIEVPIANIQHIFADRTGLGAHGETFLVDAHGLPLTPMLDPELAARPALLPSRQSCLAGESGEALGPNYRGIDVVRGFRPIPEIGGGCVVAEVSQNEAFTAEATLGRHIMVTIGLIAVAGIILSVIIADRIGAPIRRLQTSARRLQAGDFDTALEASGPAEIRDLTDAFQGMTRSLRESHESLAAANRLKDEFLATLSHELRTPLNAIRGWTALLRDMPPDSPRLARGLDVIDRNAKAQADLVSDLLDMSRVIRGTLRLDPSRIDLADVVRTAIDTLRPAAEAKRVVFDVHLISCVITADPGRMQQVAANLLSNAVKFTPPGGVVTISLARRATEVELVVSDTGEGIPADFLPHVFEPFRQADAGPARPHGGLGLGLAIVRRLVELHGGSVSAGAREKGPGACFVVRLPTIRAAETAEFLPPDETVRPSALEALRVLVVEDHEDTRELVAAVLEDHGARVDTAASASEGFEMFRGGAPDIVVADIGLPGEDGYSLIRRIRALAPGDGGAVPALALTAYARTEDRSEALAAGFNAHLAKPVDRADLVGAIASLTRATPV
jgi:signal transduction histidine kinase/ActR/RegA family two-component response regulator